MYARDDYKRCICDSWGLGEDDCPQEEGNDIVPDPDDPDDDDPVVPDDPDDDDPVVPDPYDPTILTDLFALLN